MKKHVDILNDSIIRSILHIMIPTLVSGLVQQLYSVTDSFIIGRYAGDSGLAVVGGISNNLYGYFTSSAGGLIAASLVTLAVYYGAQNHERLNKCLKTSFTLVTVLALAFIVVYNLFAVRLCRLFNVPEDILASTARYLRIYSFGYVFYALFQLCINSLRAFGEAHASSRLLIMSYAVNIAFDLVFVGLLQMAETGVALAYICSQAIGAFVAVFRVVRMTELNLLGEKNDASELGSILKVGIPGCLSNLCYSVSGTAVQTKYNLLGTSVITGNVIAGKIENIYWILIDGLFVSALTLIAQNYGARKYHRVRKIVWTCIGFGMILGLLTTGFIIIGRPYLIPLFTNDPETYEVAFRMFSVGAYLYFVYPPIDIIAAFLRCTDHATQSSILTLLTICVFRIIYVSLLKDVNYISVARVYPYSWILGTILFTGYYFLIRNKVLKEKEKEN